MQSTWPPPNQRQRWGDSHILPHTNWGNIFFDLFYVGGAYNLGSVIFYSPTRSGILYVLGTGLPAMIMWFDKMHYDARFTTGDSMVHRVFEVIQLCFVATSLSRIRPVAIMPDPYEHADMFEYSLALSVSSLMTVLRYVEVVYRVVGEASAVLAAKRDIRWRLIPTLFFMASTFVSGYAFYVNDGTYNNEHSVPIWLCLSGWISWAAFGYFEQVVWIPKEHYKELFVPMNVNFAIHRYGEWFMLMFGESVLSLIIVDGDAESTSYYRTFYAGIISVILLQHIHFRSEPHHSEEHALSRSRQSNYFYVIMVPLQSILLIMIGVSYKMFLYEFVYLDDNRRNLGGYSGTTSMEERQQTIADFFSGSIALACICSDLLLFAHKGLPRLEEEAKTFPKTAAFIVTFRVLLIMALASLSSFIGDPESMVFWGLGLILVQEIAMTFVSSIVVRNEQQHSHEDEDMSLFEKEALSFSDDYVLSRDTQ